MTLFILTLVFNLFSQNLIWEKMKAPMFSPRHHPITFSYDNFGYVLTGSEDAVGDQSLNDFYKYNPSDDSWEKLPDFPGEGRSFSYGGVFGDKAYLSCGATEDDYLKDLWEYDFNSSSWTQLDDLPAEGRAHPAFVITDNGYILISCGNNSNNNNDAYLYDIANKSWEKVDSLPGRIRHHPYYFNIGNIAYVGFGHGNGIFKDFYSFNTLTKKWKKLNDLPAEERVAGTQFALNGRGYIISGQGVDHQNFNKGEFYEYNPDNDTWEELPPHPGSGRWAPGNFLIGNKLYFLAGLSNDSLENSMMRYDLGYRNPSSINEIENLEFNITENNNSFIIESNNLIDNEFVISSIEGKIIQSGTFNKSLIFNK